ncbi:polyketide synthase [Niabella hibiscisoli]|uniref:polyketide synthase n=1 Tax=Niabella hibiscisoli TaxID=1825928 RepID=UPI001F0DCD4A|nr:polyketide synthase [Niabella hibiscisoli]MCH5720441.1 polyketide synthase [Niabella hibiscisoli]
MLYFACRHCASGRKSLRAGQSDAAIAGGVAITVPVNSGHLYEEGSMLSADGHCRPFDADARGTVFSDGVGAVLLKRLKDAEEDGDTIYAVVKGVGINNDGGNKGSFTAPSAEGQAAAILMALDDAKVNPADISYVEAHGTATPLGDPIEIDGLKLAFGKQEKKQFCSIGSVKSNFGHLTHAAGVAGFMKTVLSLHHKQLAPSINFTKPNPHIDFQNSPFVVNHTFRAWETEGKRIAGVSSLGVGGTNAHVVLEEYGGKEAGSKKRSM